MSKKPFYAILRWERKDNSPILFLPQVRANIGNIVCYQHVGQHSEATMDYYIRNTSPYTIKQWRSEAAKSLLKEYAAKMEPDQELVLVHKDRSSFRVERYSR